MAGLELSKRLPHSCLTIDTGGQLEDGVVKTFLWSGLLHSMGAGSQDTEVETVNS